MDRSNQVESSRVKAQSVCCLLVLYSVVFQGKVSLATNHGGFPIGSEDVGETMEILTLNLSLLSYACTKLHSYVHFLRATNFIFVPSRCRVCHACGGRGVMYVNELGKAR